jgi:DNA-binding transcriptional ArsR family regulator
MTNKSNLANPGLSDAQLRAVAELFAVLSEPTRLRILQHLHAGGPATVGDVVAATGVKQANASKQLNLLHRAGVCAREPRGNAVLYSVRLPLVLELCDVVCARLRDDAHAKASALA